MLSTQPHVLAPDPGALQHFRHLALCITALHLAGFPQCSCSLSCLFTGEMHYRLTEDGPAQWQSGATASYLCCSWCSQCSCILLCQLAGDLPYVLVLDRAAPTVRGAAAVGYPCPMHQNLMSTVLLYPSVLAHRGQALCAGARPTHQDHGGGNQGHSNYRIPAHCIQASLHLVCSVHPQTSVSACRNLPLCAGAGRDSTGVLLTVSGTAAVGYPCLAHQSLDVQSCNIECLLAGDLPYVLALDRPTKSVVVAIRGTVSIADLATDMLADPEPMEEWLPKSMKAEVNSRLLHAVVQCSASHPCAC